VTQAIKVVYAYGTQTKVDYNSGSQKEYCFRFEGLNIAEDHRPVVIECYRVGFYVVNQFKVQGAKSSDLTVRGALLRDTLKPEGSQFFKELLL